MTDAKGQVFNYSYDALNRVTLADAIGKQRIEEKAKTLKGLDDELEKYGRGSYDTWFDSLKEFRTNIAEQIDLNKPENWGPPRRRG